MKLAEALILRADYQARLAQLKQRLLQNAQVQEGDAVAEEPRALLEQIEGLAAGLTRLIQRINHTNLATSLDEQHTLTDALAVRDVLRLRQGVYRDLAQAAQVKSNRYSRSELRYESTVEVAAIQQQADELARAYRELDARIQATNWAVELIE